MIVFGKTIRNLKIGIAVLLAFAGLMPSSGPQAQVRDLLVIANPQAPHKFEENGVPKGIDIEVIDKVFERLNISYKVDFIETDSRILREARNGSMDMLLLFSKNPEREEYLVYPKESYVNISWNFFVRAEDKDRIKYESLADLEGLLIGITRDISYTEEFLNSGLRFDVDVQNHLQIGKLVAGRFDAVPLNTMSTLYELKQNDQLDEVSYLAKPLKSKPYYNVFVKASTYPGIESLPARYDAVIKELKADGTIDGIVRKYIGDD
ncbi:substrate-binding periplasmic protein [Roseibium sediminicola]|uniref:ABC transporter substrate-binding protein n=1 Tax=Roseibium sediminicola TaxID=2933272 RepID=A0ABT0GY80_9HYPH|nr:ABC transporter substrate-binding protein [Roseibium sp. CAU 1639]MCK7614391.1 ABC transporter substrate-binding protein [Roseibium sp. CAU 1639]